MKREIDKLFWFCPVCGKTANMFRSLSYERYLNCLHCRAVTELKTLPYKEV